MRHNLIADGNPQKGKVSMTKANSAVAQEMVRRRVEKQFWKFLDQTSRIADQLTDLMYGDQSLSSAEHIAVADALKIGREHV